VLNQTTLKWTALNWTIQSQIKACIAKSSCEISALLRYYTAISGNSLTTFQDNLSVPTSRVKKGKKENKKKYDKSYRNNQQNATMY